jgi:hypothetical protein
MFLACIILALNSCDLFCIQIILMFTFLQVRQVPFKDKMEEEWELFQRTMKEEAVVSRLTVDIFPSVLEVKAGFVGVH